MNRLTDPDLALEQFVAPRFKLSPDERRFLAVTRRGNLATGLNEYSLLLFEVSDVLKFVNSTSATELPSPETAATFATSSQRHGIDQVKWLPDSRTLAFIGRGTDEIGQVYTLDIGTRRLRQLTHHSADIATFDVSGNQESLIYTAYTPPDWDARNKHGYAIKSQYFLDLSIRDPRDAIPEIRHFAMNVPAGRTLSVAMESAMIPREVALSPSGRWAVVLELVEGVPSSWREYAILRRYLRFAPTESGSGNPGESESAHYDNDAFGGRSDSLGRYLLVDMATGAARPLIDAPVDATGLLATAIWSRNESTVVLAPTFLPLDVTSKHELDRRRHTQTIAEVDVARGKVLRVTDLQERAPDGHSSIFLTRVERLNDGDLLVQQRQYGADETPAKTYRKRGDQWFQGRGAIPTPRVVLSLVQDMNSPPEIVARDRETGRRRVITDLNPQVREMTMGRIEIFEWSDRLGRQFVGGLVHPPGFERGRHYPVVIQTYGFKPGEYLVDGSEWRATAYAARALANKGMLVLQMPEYAVEQQEGRKEDLSSSTKWTDNGENPRFVAMLEAAIDALDARQLIDRKRVGLIGFSREGMHVHYAITFSDYPIAAATVSDAAAATPLSYALYYGASYPGMLEYEDPLLIGAPFWADGIKLWLERSPIFHLDRIRTPLRIESLGIYFNPYWDTFAILKRHRRPVEMIHVPLGTHLLETPFTRYASQQGNVDWFTFWLIGDEDPDPTKAEQYKRWRKLREQHEAASTGSDPSQNVSP